MENETVSPEVATQSINIGDYLITEAMWPFMIALVGYVVAHLLNGWRDRRAKQREIKVKFLIEAYSSLTQIIAAEKWDLQAFKKVLADLQLMGNEAQIAEVKRISEEFPEAYAGKNRGIVDVDRLLKEIRNDLRSDLSMNPVATNFIWLIVKKRLDQQ